MTTLRIWTLTSLLLALSASATAGIEKHTVIDGIPHTLVLEQNTHLQLSDDPATHYLGHLRDSPESWVRVTQMGEQWSGLISHQDQLHEVHSLADTPILARSSKQKLTTALDGFEAIGSCAAGQLHPAALGQGSAAGQLKSSAGTKTLTFNNALTNAATLNFPTACTQTINGVCLVAELTVFFDRSFRQAYPSDYRSRGAEILNIVDGFYRNNLGIAFNLLHLDFDNGDQFTTNNNPLTILQDMQGKRFQARIRPGDPNIRSLMHLVTARDFLFDDGQTVDDNVVGLAYSTVYDVGTSPLEFYSVLCGSSGEAVATSQLIYRNGRPSAAVTAVLVAHEIGHNLGMEHDGDPESATATSCTEPTRIMYPAVITNATSFSTCSRTAAGLNISALPTVEACFDFPIEVSMTAEPGNATQTGSGAPTQHQFNVALATANGFNGNIQINGGIQAGDGAITGVTLAGNNCAVNGAQNGYSCSINSPGPTSALVVLFTTGNEHLSLQHQVSAGQNLFDINTANNSATTTVLVQGAGLAPTNLTLTLDRSRDAVVLRWQDHANDETGYQVERRGSSGGWTVVTSTIPGDAETFEDVASQLTGTNVYRVRALFGDTASAPSNEASIKVSSNRQTDRGRSGGGGGSLSWLSLGGLLLLLIRVRRRASLNNSCPT